MNKSSTDISSELKTSFEESPGCWGCKDKDSVFMYANKEYANLIGVGERNQFDIIGRTDFDMPCDTVNCADLFRRQDKTVIESEKTLSVLDIQPFAGNQWQAFIFTKTPLYNKMKDPIGTIFHGENITNSSILNLCTILSKMTANVENTLLGSQNSFLLTNQHDSINLSNPEARCLFFLLRGKSANSIANYLGLSRRMVDQLIIKLKYTFNAQSQKELIDNAIQTGFLNTIPEGLFNTQLSIMLNED